MALANRVRLRVWRSPVRCRVQGYDTDPFRGRAAPFSPLSYSADLIRVGFGGAGYFAPSLDVGALLIFSGGFLALTRVIHWVTQAKVR